MKTILVLAAILFLGTASTSLAEPQEQLNLAKEFSEVLGFQSMFNSLKAQTDRSLDQQIAQIMQQFRRELAGVPNDFFEEMDVAANEYMAKVKNAWNAQEAADIYARALAELLPPQELRKAIDHYRTPEGQNELKAINEAASRLNAYIAKNIQQASAVGLQEFIAKVKAGAIRARQRQAETRGRNSKDNDAQAPQAPPADRLPPAR